MGARASIVSTYAMLGIIAVLAVAWSKGYFKRRAEEPPPILQVAQP